MDACIFIKDPDVIVKTVAEIRKSNAEDKERKRNKETEGEIHRFSL